MIEQLISTATANPAVVVVIGLAGWWWSKKARVMAATGKLGRFAGLIRIGILGIMLAALLVVLLANRRTRHATITALMCLGVIVGALLIWIAPGTAFRMFLPLALGVGIYAWWPETGPVARWMDGQPISRATIAAAMQRSKQRRVLAEAARRSTQLPVLDVTTPDGGPATIRLGVPAGVDPHTADGIGDTLTNAVNVLAADTDTDLHAVGATVRHGAGDVTITVSTTPRRLPARVEWPGQ